MKKSLAFLCLLIVTLSACNQHDKSKITEVRLPPPPDEKAMASQKFSVPVIKADNETLENKAFEAPVEEIDEPVGNADVKSVAEKPVDTEKKVIKEGDISFETGDVAETRKQIISSLKKLGGYADDDSESTNGDEGRKEYVLSIRIPAKNFDAFLGTVSSTATKIDSRNIRIKDVTSEFIDVKTRLDNKLQLEKRYLNLLSRAGKMRDLLDIEEKLTQIRSDIEATQGQLNYMSKQVAYSSLTITFYTKQAEQVAAGNGFGYKFKNALTSGWEFLQGLFFGIITLWPVWFSIGVLWVLIKKWRGRKAVAETD